MTKPTRKRFQIHLSTAIVLMFVAGGIIWANVNERLRYVDGDKGFEGDYFRLAEFGSPMLGAANWAGGRKFVRGWPCEAMQSITSELSYDSSTRTWARSRVENQWRISAIVVNALVAFMLLLAVSFACEWLIRRRATRKKA